jgi:hypothetical protein
MLSRLYRKVNPFRSDLLLLLLIRQSSMHPVDQNYFTDHTELEVMSYVETYQEATGVEIL